MENQLDQQERVRLMRVLLRNAAKACLSAHMTDFGPANEWAKLDAQRKSNYDLPNHIRYASLEEAANWKV